MVDDPVSPDPVDPPAPISAPKSAASSAVQPETPDTGLPRFLDRNAPRPFEDVLKEVKEARAAKAAVPAPAAQEPDTTVLGRDPALLRTALLAASRIVLVGPCGAGKTQVALQLALLRRGQNPHVPISFVFCGTGSKADGAVLAQKSHLLGMKTIFKKPADLDAPSCDGTEIVVISGRSTEAFDEARSLLAAADTKALLVLPDGMRPDRVARLGTQWREVTSWGAIGHVAPADMGDVDVASFAQSDVDLLWVSASDTLVGGLHTTPLKDSASAVSAPETVAKKAPEQAPVEPASQVVFRRHQMKSEARP